LETLQSILQGSILDPATLIELAKADPRVLEIVRCPVTELDNPGICLTLYAWCKDNHDVIQVRWALNESVVKAFDREGIKTPQVNGVVLRKTN
jgi:hypothetical protein